MTISTIPAFPRTQAASPPMTQAPRRTRRAAAILQALIDAGESWADRAEYATDSRWFARLGDVDGIELWLLSWLPGQGTDLHDHGGSAGAFTVLRGELREEVITSVRTLPVLSAREYAVGDIRPFGERHIHRVRNHGDVPAVSLHAYEPALQTMTRYQLGHTGLEEIGIEKAGVAW